MYFNANKVVIIEPELEQAIITTLKNTPNIANILKNAKEIAPFTYETNFDDITYTIYTKQEQIQKIEYKDKLDNKVVIEFLNQSINGYLDASLFEVVIPQEFDIITQ
jgi:outer membrane lipoprotein carrier protein